MSGLCFAAFQMTFAIIASAIISGSLVERMRFSALDGDSYQRGLLFNAVPSGLD